MVHQAAASTTAGTVLGTLIGLILIGLGIIAYSVPTIVVLARKAPNVTPVVLVTIFLGWTLIGWVVALVMAMRPKQQTQPYPPYQSPPTQAPPPPYERPPYGRPGGFGVP